MLLEVVLVICDTEVTSADELIMKGRFNMVEFGEQRRKGNDPTVSCRAIICNQTGSIKVGMWGSLP